MARQLPAIRALAICTILVIATHAAAQSTVPPGSLVGRFVDLQNKTNQIAAVLNGLPTPEQGLEVPVLARLLSLEVSTAPLGTSTGGFTFTRDDSTGEFTRSAQTFGPLFGKRSLTSGRGRFSAGFNWLHADYSSLQGLDLQNGEYRPARNGTNVPIGYSSLRMNLSSETIVGFLTYGVTNDVDIGIGVPWIRISLDADVGLFTPANIDVTPGGHLLEVPRTSASGIGDIAVFGKYRVWRSGAGGLAAEIEMRLPSGDTNSLRGSGLTRTNLSAIFSRAGKLSPHANIGYEIWSRKVLLGQGTDDFAKDQITYEFGVEFEAHPLATAIIDFIGRRQLHAGQSGYRTMPFGPGTVEGLVILPEALDVIHVAPGIKWNVAPNVLLNCSLLTTITNKGLRAKVIPVVGLDWTF